MFVPNGCQNSSHKLPSVDPFPFPSYQILSSQGVTLTNCTSVNLLVAPASSTPHSSFPSCLKDKALQSSRQDRAASCSYWHAHLAESARIIVPPCWDEHFATGQYKGQIKSTLMVLGFSRSAITAPGVGPGIRVNFVSGWRHPQDAGNSYLGIGWLQSKHRVWVQFLVLA